MAISFIGSTGGSAINGGNVTLTLPGTYSSGDVAVVTVTLGTSKATSLSVASSSGGAFSQIVTTTNSSFARFGVFRQVLASTTSVQAVITGSGGSTDSTSGVVHIFRGVDNTTPEDATPTSTTGSGTSWDSPSITPVTSNDVILTCVGGQTILAITAPSSFSDATTASGNDTFDCRSGQAWITNATTSAFDPAAWTSTATVSWVAATVALRPFIPPDIFWASFAAGPDIAPQIDEMRRVTVRSYF